MKKLLATVALAAGLLPAVAARAQVFGQFGPADILPVNTRSFGGYLDLSQNTVGALGQLRLSFYPNIDFGFQGGLSRIDTGPSKKTAVSLGGDLRFGAGTVAKGMPVDLAVGAAIGVQTSDNYTILSLGPEAVASRSFGFSQNAAVVPYAGAMLMFSSVNIASESQTDFSVPLRLGAELRAIPGVRLLGELQLRLGDEFNDHTGWSLGANFPF